MSDSYFIGTVARVQNLWRFGRPISADIKITPSSSPSPPNPTPQSPNPTNTLSNPLPKYHELASLEAAENVNNKTNATIGMMVSLDHTIYFHHPRECRADEWLFSEMESPWAGNGRGLVLQRIWSRDGKLVASCVQEVSCGFWFGGVEGEGVLMLMWMLLGTGKAEAGR